VKILRLLLCIPALACVAFIRLVYPIWHIRLGYLMSNRIGHLAGNTEVYLCERDAGLHKTTDFWTHHGDLCNEFFGKMVSRTLKTDPTRFLLLVILCNKLFDGWQRHDANQGTLDRDPKNLMEKSQNHFSFTAEEIARGEKNLQTMGIPEGAKWVCLVVRDSAYLPDLGYHSFRDTDIDTYQQAALALTKRGYYVIRMGAKVNKPMPMTNGKIIDYAKNGMRTDFMDIYLMAHCAFCISTGTGLDAVAVAFRRPVCYVNYVPIQYLFTFLKDSLAIWKHYEKDGKRLSLKEIYESGVDDAMFAQQFVDKEIKLVDNTPEEITAAVEEMADMAEGWQAAENNQDWFWKDFPRRDSSFLHTPLHGEIRMRIGREFLKGYQ